jgi:hypothetical protein
MPEQIPLDGAPRLRPSGYAKGCILMAFGGPKRKSSLIFQKSG